MNDFNKVEVVGPLTTKCFLDSTQNFTGPIGNFVALKPQAPQFVSKDLTIYPVPLGSDVLSAIRFCYVGETPRLAGKFFLEKAVELGVPKGPSFSKLKNGQSVTLPDGTIIHPDQVLGEPVLAQHFAIVCRLQPTDEQELQSLFTASQFSRFQSSGNSEVIRVMVHMSGAATVNLPSYQAWLKSFGALTQHIFTGQGCANVHGNAFASERIYHHKLSHLFSQVFPSLQAPYQQAETLQVDLEGAIAADPMMRYHLLPPKRAGLDVADSQALLQKVLTAKQTAVDKVTADTDAGLMIRARDYANLPTTPLTQPNNVRLFFLGTGCSIPSKYRNVSGMLLYHPMSHSGIMLDCGEGSWFQLQRLSPPPSALSADIFNRETAWASIVQAVWISHLHADHHLGLITVIVRRRELLPRCQPLLIIAPMAVLQFLEQVVTIIPSLEGAFVCIPANYFDPLDLCTSCGPAASTTAAAAAADSNEINIDVNQQNSNSLREVSEGTRIALAFGNKRRRQEELRILGSAFGNEASVVQAAKDQLLSVGIVELINVPVIHCPQACGIILTLQTGAEQTTKIVFSGDTRPCDTLVTWGEGADLLIHEATFEDDKAVEAVAKKHSTIAEAIDVATRMNASSLIMTHFSQRYDGVPLQFQTNHAAMEVVEESSAQKIQPIIAFDFMSIGCADLTWAEGLTPLLAEIFPATDANEAEETTEET